jgi:hypothetical protein
MSGIDRVRAYRERARRGRTMLRIEIDQFALAEALVMGGFLREWDMENRQEIAHAVERMIDRLIESSH